MLVLHIAVMRFISVNWPIRIKAVIVVVEHEIADVTSQFVSLSQTVAIYCPTHTHGKYS